MFKISLMAILLVTGFFASACGGEEEKAETAIRLPEREVTWVRKQAVRKSSLSGNRQNSTDIPLNESLVEKLKKATSAAGTGSVTDQKSCLAGVKRLDVKRTAVQKAGGMWHAFERSSETRPHSSNGMQLDSQTNKMVFALAYLCRTATGKPMDPMEQWVDYNMKTMGKEAAINKFSDIANRGDAESWVEHLEVAKKNVKRTVDYQTIEKLINRAEPLVNLYEELSKRPIDDAETQAFLSDSVTLLNSLNQFITSDKILVMAVKEDDSAPYYNLESEM